MIFVNLCKLYGVKATKLDKIDLNTLWEESQRRKTESHLGNMRIFIQFPK